MYGPNCCRTNTSETSSKVPMPPGSATKASASSSMRVFRANMSSVSSRRLKCGCTNSKSASPRGMTPITSPPAAKQAEAASPMSPTLAPPYTMVMLRRASSSPSSAAASANSGRSPMTEPQYTVTAVMSGLSVRNITSSSFWVTNSLRAYRRRAGLSDSTLTEIPCHPWVRP